MFNNGRYVWEVNTMNGESNSSLGGIAPLNQWVHLTGTYDGAVARLYVNGVEVYAVPHTGTLRTETTNPLIIGGNVNDASGNPSDLFAGRIDDVRLYGRALSTAEIQALYGGQHESAAGGECSGLRRALYGTGRRESDGRRQRQRWHGQPCGFLPGVNTAWRRHHCTLHFQLDQRSGRYIFSDGTGDR